MTLGKSGTPTLDSTIVYQLPEPPFFICQKSGPNENLDHLHQVLAPVWKPNPTLDSTYIYQLNPFFLGQVSISSLLSSPRSPTQRPQQLRPAQRAAREAQPPRARRRHRLPQLRGTAAAHGGQRGGQAQQGGKVTWWAGGCHGGWGGWWPWLVGDGWVAMMMEIDLKVGKMGMKDVWRFLVKVRRVKEVSVIIR